MTKKILIIDDEPHLLKIMSGRLKANNFDVITAGDGEAGLKKAQEENPDVILLDISMPLMDGYEVLKNLKEDEKTKDIKVIMLTATTDRESVECCMELGAIDYAVKPINPALLIEKIRKVL